MRITALIGAGAVIELGGPTTACLTSAVSNTIQQMVKENKISSKKFLRQVEENLNLLFRPDTANFEDIFHALETLSSFCTGWGRAAKEFKPHACAFTKPIDKSIDDSKWFDHLVLREAKKDLIETVAERVFRYDSNYAPQEKDSWFAKFWQDAIKDYRWDIATLNYDTCIDRSIPRNNLTDGFDSLDDDPSIQVFNPIELLQSQLNNKNRSLHLHGCIRYGYSNKPSRDGLSKNLYKYTNYKCAKETWFGRSINQNQAGEEAIAGPIITGMRKTDKLLDFPYSIYYHLLTNVLINSPRLLIIGYSYGDYHFNSLLKLMVNLHREKRRIVIVDYFPHAEECWSSDPYVMDWPSSRGFEMLNVLFCQSSLFPNQFQNLIQSEDKCVKLYLKGTMDAMKNHSDEIIKFLTGDK